MKYSVKSISWMKLGYKHIDNVYVLIAVKYLDCDEDVPLNRWISIPPELEYYQWNKMKLYRIWRKHFNNREFYELPALMQSLYRELQ